ncbi:MULTISPECIES: preprotein translocase subunit SecG [Micrococcus]|uniref:preprotein translocase subunit SecG n=1 Tax=Micrococcus TaxID=1269 RepID=UPI001CCABDC6|nr:MULTISPECIES: preprotein translocase subunit SecG [Micrococcus]MCG7421721.1 preprotein translocase subunit SecG [Micrococcus sp. ACRRV]UBH23907.1 preprotein translocase subunit SecG [Micrococcus porci]
MDILTLLLQIAVVALSVVIIMLVLLHKGRGGGVSDMFGGGVTTSMSSSGSAQRLLTRVTVSATVLWGLAIVALALIARFSVES